jgi:hypothetical protein
MCWFESSLTDCKSGSERGYNYGVLGQGDELLSVDGSSVTGKTAFEAASLIQGPKGTPVSIEVSPFLSVIKAVCILLVQVQCHVDTLHIVFLSHMLLCVSIL